MRLLCLRFCTRALQSRLQGMRNAWDLRECLFFGFCPGISCCGGNRRLDLHAYQKGYANLHIYICIIAHLSPLLRRKKKDFRVSKFPLRKTMKNTRRSREATRKNPTDKNEQAPGFIAEFLLQACRYVKSTRYFPFPKNSFRVLKCLYQFYTHIYVHIL